MLILTSKAGAQIKKWSNICWNASHCAWYRTDKKMVVSFFLSYHRKDSLISPRAAKRMRTQIAWLGIRLPWLSAGKTPNPFSIPHTRDFKDSVHFRKKCLKTCRLEQPCRGAFFLAPQYTFTGRKKPFLFPWALSYWRSSLKIVSYLQGVSRCLMTCWDNKQLNSGKPLCEMLATAFPCLWESNPAIQSRWNWEKHRFWNLTNLSLNHNSEADSHGIYGQIALSIKVLFCKMGMTYLCKVRVTHARWEGISYLLLHNKSPPKLISSNQHLWSHSVCGCGILAWLSWVLWLRASLKAAIQVSARVLVSFQGSSSLIGHWPCPVGLWR